MKHFALKSLWGLVMLILFAGCDLFDKVDDVTIEIEIHHTFEITEDFDSDGEPVSYSDIGTIDATKDADFDKYKDKIKEFTVHSVEYTVTDYAAEGEVIFSNGMGTFYAQGSTANALAEAGITIQSVQASQGGAFTLDYTTAGLEAIANQLESVHKVDFEVAGTFSHTPVYFNVPVTLKCTIVADALD